MLNAPLRIIALPGPSCKEKSAAFSSLAPPSRKRRCGTSSSRSPRCMCCHARSVSARTGWRLSGTPSPHASPGITWPPGPPGFPEWKLCSRGGAIHKEATLRQCRDCLQECSEGVRTPGNPLLSKRRAAPSKRPKQKSLPKAALQDNHSRKSTEIQQQHSCRKTLNGGASPPPHASTASAPMGII